MGGEISQERSEAFSVNYYNTALQNPCLLPDVGIDQSLLKYSGANSNAELQSFSNELIDNVPGFVGKFGNRVAPFTSVPDAVGLGALVISMILEIIVKNTAEASEDSYSMIQRVFAEEKGSSVRDTMTEYVRRHHRFMKDQQRLRLELNRLEMQLSGHLTVLRNSLLFDGHLTSRGFKIWVNGAFFHLQMLIHEARLKHQAGQLAPTQVDSIKTYVDLYLQDLDHLLEKYKTYFTTVTKISLNPCLLPDVGIDESLLKYSGANSTAELQSFSNELIDSVPDFVGKFGNRVAPFTSVPDAVGLGALVISMVLEIIVKNTADTDGSYSMMRRVFAEEKGSSVRDTMTEYVRRHRTFMKNEQRLRLELKRLETQLSGHLTVLRNSLLFDRHLTSRGFKIWVNGAFFHLQMLIHEARLNHQAGQLAPTQVDSINTYVDLYLQELDHLLEKYKTYLTTVNEMVSVIELKSQFINVKSSVNVLIKQHDTFSLW
ncbi:unnamed protein product [Pleuronectes platessa]|uniref:Uncharacterized protein n=1 Tax=Pleuronectes platessa TaxID=8262 RepID=A0A9N7UVI0_PLEPL|nr:unnamed protein product [Pleuronectes platessa]